jgi:hypothetical protein
MGEEGAGDPARCGVDDRGGLGRLAVTDEHGRTDAGDQETAHVRHEKEYTWVASASH